MTATDIKKYAIVGVGGRSRFYYQALVGKYKDTSKLVGFCDVNQTRMDYANTVIAEKFGHPPVKTYYAWQFEQMIEETKPDIVIVTSIDRTHDRYIIAAMNLGCDVITEKPMTIDEVRCQNILDTVKATGRELRVT